jgi:hypothetical protein
MGLGPQQVSNSSNFEVPRPRRLIERIKKRRACPLARFPHVKSRVFVGGALVRPPSYVAVAVTRRDCAADERSRRQRHVAEKKYSLTSFALHPIQSKMGKNDIFKKGPFR